MNPRGSRPLSTPSPENNPGPYAKGISFVKVKTSNRIAHAVNSNYSSLRLEKEPAIIGDKAGEAIVKGND